MLIKKLRKSVKKLKKHGCSWQEIHCYWEEIENIPPEVIKEIYGVKKEEKNREKKKIPYIFDRETLYKKVTCVKCAKELDRNYYFTRSGVQCVACNKLEDDRILRQRLQLSKI